MRRAQLMQPKHLTSSCKAGVIGLVVAGGETGLMAEKVRALCAVLAAVAAVAGAQKAPPASDVLPDSWTATISANIYQPGRGKAYTLSRDEWYDRNQSRVRIDEAQPFGSLTQIAQFSSNTTRIYSVLFTDEAPQGFCQVCFSSKDDLKSQSQPHTCILHGSTLCFVQAKDEEARENLQSRFYTGDSGFLRSTREFFNYPDNPDDTLNFVTETSPFASFRGARELWWEYNFSIPDSDASYTIYYGFSEDSWSFPNEDRQSPRLQAIILNGTSPPRDEENEPKAVHHSYEFYDLRPLGAVDAEMLDPCMLAKDNAACGCGGSNPRAFGCTWAVKEFPDQFNDDEQLDENQCTGPEYWAFSSCTTNSGNGNLHASLATTANPYSPETPKSERLNKSIIAVRYKDDRELSEPDLQACVVDAQLPIDASATEYDNSDAAAEVRGCTDLEPSADSLGVFISRYPNSSLPEVIPPGASTAEQAGSERFLAISFTNGTTIGLCALIPQAPALPDVWMAGIERNRIVQDASSNSDEGNGTTEYFKEAFSAVQNRVRYDTGNSSATRVVIEVPSANTEYVLTKSAENNYRGTCELRATGEESRLEQRIQSISSTSDAFNFYDDNVEYLGCVNRQLLIFFLASFMKSSNALRACNAGVSTHAEFLAMKLLMVSALHRFGALRPSIGVELRPMSQTLHFYTSFQPLVGRTATGLNDVG